MSTRWPGTLRATASSPWIIDHDGVIDDGSEIFTPNFDGGSFATGGDALASLDSNGDGVIDADDEAFAKLLIWQDADADGVSDAGELSSLADHGITSITAPSNPASGEIDGQSIIGEGTFTRADGTTGNYVEVALETELGTAAQSDGHEPQTFVVDDLAVVELIPDYSFDDGDQIDLSALLEGNFGPDGDNVSDFVRLQTSGNDLTLQVDMDGTAEAHGWTDVATLPGLAGVSEVIKVIFSDDTEKTVTT